MSVSTQAAGHHRDGAQRIKQFVMRHIDDAVHMLAELVKNPSDNPPGDCAPHANRVAQLYQSIGLKAERHPVPRELVNRAGMTSATNLIVRHRFGPGPTVALNVHGDVVAPGTGWSVDPYGASVKDGWMYGRGVATSKSDIVTYAYALLALLDLGDQRSGSVEIHVTYDEETGGDVGPRWLLQEGLTKPDFAICAGLSYGVVTAHNGCLHLEIEIIGKSAHAARPETGVDALEAAVHIAHLLYEMRQTFRSKRSRVEGITTPSMVIGLITGGINTNVVPDRVVMRLDRRIIPEEDGEVVAIELKTFIEKIAKHISGIACNVKQVMLASPLKPLSGSQKLSDVICQNASMVFGEPIKSQGVPLYTDARHYCSAGIPTVLYGAGPRTMIEANAHRADERLRLSDLAKATEVVALALRDLLTEA
jgi:succinyl-diaminopimelate desuccinylase